MARAQKQKAMRQSTAAYAASQPLFDALRTGSKRVIEQKKELVTARDIVQNLHVQLPNLDSKSEVDKQQCYTDCMVKAWRSATEIYADIFETLANVTAAVQEEARPARDGHAKFAEMARTALVARNAARGFTLYEDTANADRSAASKAGEKRPAKVDKEAGGEVEGKENDEVGDDNSSSAASSREAEELEGKEKPSVEPTPLIPSLLQHRSKRPLPDEPPDKVKDEPPQKAIRYSNHVKHDAQGREILRDKGVKEPNVLRGTLNRHEKKAWKDEKSRQEGETKQQKRLEKRMKTERTNGHAQEQDFISLNAAEPVQASLRTESAAPPIQYEDASAEVDARLKAKEAKKEAAKKEKKRKRESGDSLVSREQESKIEEPKKKKVKSAEDAGGDEMMAKKEKRKINENGEGHGKKKRKKA